MEKQDAVEQAARIPFAFGWYSWGLGEYRPIPDGTYGLFLYETLPPLPTPDPTFSYLAPDDAPPDPMPSLDEYSPNLRRELEAIILRRREQSRLRLDALPRQAAHLGLTLPSNFLRFMASPTLQSRILSCCWSSLSARPVPCPGFTGGYLVGFLHDQQACLSWCLCLTPDGRHCVLALPVEAVETLPASEVDALYGHLGSDSDESEDMGSDRATLAYYGNGNSEEAASAINDIRICAESFDSFIYRFWVESEISRKLIGHDKTPLTEVERQYLDHYERQKCVGA